MKKKILANRLRDLIIDLRLSYSSMGMDGLEKIGDLKDYVWNVYYGEQKEFIESHSCKELEGLISDVKARLEKVKKLEEEFMREKRLKEDGYQLVKLVDTSLDKPNLRFEEMELLFNSRIIDWRFKNYRNCVGVAIYSAESLREMKDLVDELNDDSICKGYGKWYLLEKGQDVMFGDYSIYDIEEKLDEWGIKKY